MFIAVVLTIAKVWKQSKWFKWIKKVYNGIFLIHTQKNELWPFAKMWVNLESIMFSEISQTNKDKYYILLLTCGI